jgi:hypothetical protein
MSSISENPVVDTQEQISSPKAFTDEKNIEPTKKKKKKKKGGYAAMMSEVMKPRDNSDDPLKHINSVTGGGKFSKLDKI